jgi:2-phospho-L-lactate guanylyltransferase
VPEINKRIWAVVPVKAFSQAKSRLSSVLTQPARAGLAKAMLRDVLLATTGSKKVERTVVITADPEVSTLARQMGVFVLNDRCNMGQNEAVEQACQAVKSEENTALLTLPGDLPLLTVPDIDGICSLLSSDKDLVIARAVNDGGTNAILSAQPSLMEFHFGDNSFKKHIDAAEKLGLKIVISDIAGFQLDLDRPEDLEEFIACASASETHSFLRAIQPDYACGGSLE